MAGKKKGKKGKSQQGDQQSTGAEQPGSSQGEPSKQQEHQAPQLQQQSSASREQQQPSHSQQQSGPQGPKKQKVRQDQTQQYVQGQQLPPAFQLQAIPQGQPQRQGSQPPSDPQGQQQQYPRGPPQQYPQGRQPPQMQQHQGRQPPSGPQGRQQQYPRGSPQQYPQGQQPPPMQQHQGRQPLSGPQGQHQQYPRGPPQQYPQGQQPPPMQQHQGRQPPSGPQGQQQQYPRGPPQQYPQGQQPPQMQQYPAQQPQRGPWGQQPGIQPQLAPQLGNQGPSQQFPPGFAPHRELPTSAQISSPHHVRESGQPSQRGQQSWRGRGRGAGQGSQQSTRTDYQSQPLASSSPTPSAVGQQSKRGRGRGRGSGPQHSPSTRPEYQSQTTSPTPGASSSSSSTTEGSAHDVSRQLAKMHVTKGKEAGQGDSKFDPIEAKVAVKPGTQGKKILVETNHLALNVGTLTTAYHYDVKLEPELPKKLLRSVLETFRIKHYKERYPAFDGRKNLYSSSPLPFGDFIADEIVIIPDKDTKKTFKVEIKFANKVDLTGLKDLLKSRVTPREALQVVDIVLRSAPPLSCISVGRSFFIKPTDQSRNIVDLGGGMLMYTGFYQSAIRGWKPFLNVDVAHKAFPKGSNLIDLLPEILSSQYQEFRRDDLNKPLPRYHLDTLNSFVKGLKVIYEIPNVPATRRVYRVNGLDESPKTKTFKLDNGQMISIQDYFERNKNYRLRYPHLPSLWVGAHQRANKILLPLELCTLEEHQVINRKMNDRQTSNMIKVAATNTTVRKDKIMTALKTANHNVNPTVREFGFSIANQFERLEARVLRPPSLKYANKNVNPFKGVWRGEQFVHGAIIKKWTIVCVDRRPARPDSLSSFADLIFKNASYSGMFIETPAEKPFDHVGGSQSLRDIQRYFQIKGEKKYDVIFVVVPGSGPQYSYVKTAAEINVGCLTQCIKSNTLNRMNQQTAINILLKVNSKLNGTNHILNTTPPIMKSTCMIMGADVTHPSPDSRNIPSVAAVTASHEPRAFKYNICWRLQQPTVEIIEDLEAIVVEQLKFFYRQSRSKPEKIIFFRDGVSEGQFEQVRRAEIKAIRSACKRLQADGYEPAITFLVVQKRHHTRLFPTNPNDSEDRNCNVPAGTCVDTMITHPFMQDFYLVSHASIQGVAKPTKYCTLWDDNNLTNDEIEELTYYLCHMFTRCNRSVSYPAPTYYAHLAAARAKVYIENESLDMENLQREFARFRIQDSVQKGLPMFFV